MNADATMVLGDLPVEVQIHIIHFLSKDDACQLRNMSHGLKKNLNVATISRGLKNDSCFERVGSRIDIQETCLLKMIPAFPCRITHSIHCTIQFPKEIGYFSKQLRDGFEIVDGNLQGVNTIRYIFESRCNFNLYLEFVPKEGQFYSLYCVFPDKEILDNIKKVDTNAVVVQKPETIIIAEFYNLMRGAIEWKNGVQWKSMMQKYLANDSSTRELMKGALRYEYNLGVPGFQYTEETICVGGITYDIDKEIDSQVFTFDEILEIKECRTMTLLHLACQNNAPLNVIQFILDILGVDEICRDCSRVAPSTPVHIVSNNGRADVLRLFISVGRHCHIKYEGNEAILVGCMRLACINGHIEIVKYFLESKGIKLAHATAKRGTSCFFEATRYGHIEIVKYLLQNGHNAILFTRDNGGWSCLHEASQHGHLEIVKLFIQSGGDRILKLTDNQLFRPQHIAFKHGQMEVYNFLRDAEKDFC